MAIDSSKHKKEPTLEEVLDELERNIDRCKVFYEQYFLGIQKVEPQSQRREVARKIIEITQQNIRNTGVRFRFHALNQKWNMYTAYWNRTVAQIENGTYVRDIARAQRNLKRRGLELPEEMRRGKMAAKLAQIERQTQAERDVANAKSRAGARHGEEIHERVVARSAIPEPIDRNHDTAPQAPLDLGEIPELDLPARKSAPKITWGKSAQFQALRGRETAPSAGDPDIDAMFDQIADTRTPSLSGPTTESIQAIPEQVPDASKTQPQFAAAVRGVVPAPGPQTMRVATLPRAPSPAAPSGGASGIGEAELRAVYRQFVEAKQAAGESTDKLSFESVSRSIAKAVPQLMQKPGARGVELKVTTEGGKVVLKALPKR